MSTNFLFFNFTNMAEVHKGGNYQEQLDKLFGKIYLSMPDKFSRHNWKILSEVAYDATDFDINKTASGKITVMFIPTPTKETTYSTYEQESGNPFKLIEAMKFIRGGVTVEEAKSLLTLNLTGKGRDVVVLFPNPRSETVDVYIIEKVKYQTQEVIQGTASDIKYILNPKSVDLGKGPSVDNPMPELLKKATRQEADSQLKNTQENLRQSSYNVLVDNVNAAKKAGVDVSDIEAQMPELLKKIQR